MANLQHLELLKKGASAVEDWQSKNKGKMLDLSYADLHDTNLSGFNLQNGYFFGTDLSYANLSKAQLLKANFTCSDLSGADFSDANLTRAGLGFSEIKYPTLSNTNLLRADLTGATLDGPIVKGEPVSLKGAIMVDTILADCTMTDFSDLDSVRHKGPSHVDIDTLIVSYMKSNKKFDKVLTPFFLNAGVPKSLLDALPDIVAGIKYSSCFVCYGEPDRAFAEELVNNLKAKGIQAWIYSLDSTPGQKVWKEINEKRRKLDKMIVLCSAQSLVRPGVKKELEEQIDEDPEKMIPISLDSIWTQEGFNVTRDGRDLKHYLTECTYADFSDSSNYGQAFSKLVKALAK